MSLILAAAQSASVPGDVPRNAARHLHFAKLAAERGVQLLVFPELSLTGYELTLARANAVRPDCAELDPLRQLAADSGMTIAVGAPVPNESGGLYIGALVLRPDGSVWTHSKVYVHESELGVFVPGPGGPVFPVEESTVALAICRDAKQPQHAADAAARGANVYAAGVMVDEPGYAPKVEFLERYAKQFKMATLMANYSGVTGGDVSAGKSCIWSEEGRVVAASTGTGEELIIGTKIDGQWTGLIVPV